MKAVAITGSPGSGKSSVLKIFRSLGYPAIDCDSIVAGLYKKKPVQKRLSKAFGASSKKSLLSIMLSSEKKRRRLERMLHPPVWKELRKRLLHAKSLGKKAASRQRLSSFRKQGKAIVFVEVALLFEANWHKRFDSIVFVRAPKRKCLQRLVKQGFSKKHALLLWNAQLSPEKKVKSSHYTINNGAGLASMKKQAKKILVLLKS